jgi:hypothetical protein
MKKSEPLIIKEFGQGFYAVLIFTGQQYKRIINSVALPFEPSAAGRLSGWRCKDTLIPIQKSIQLKNHISTT